jgi:glycosyltransferase involved in cell wall biosynthesis
VDGYLIPQEPEAIAEKILFLLQNEAAARQMGTAGKKKLEENYTWHRIAQRVETVYKNLIGTGG